MNKKTGNFSFGTGNLIPAKKIQGYEQAIQPQVIAKIVFLYILFLKVGNQVFAISKVLFVKLDLKCEGKINSTILFTYFYNI